MTEIASSQSLGKTSREALARKLYEFEEEKTMENEVSLFEDLDFDFDMIDLDD